MKLDKKDISLPSVANDQDYQSGNGRDEYQHCYGDQDEGQQVHKLAILLVLLVHFDHSGGCSGRERPYTYSDNLNYTKG